MTSMGKGWLRKSLLIGIYALGVFGILASGDGDNDVIAQDFTCGLSVRGIAPVGDGTVWVGVFAKTDSGTEDRIVLLDTDGSELLSYLIGNGGTENAIRTVVLDALGNTYVGGYFAAGILSEGILRLDVNGMLDPTFDPTGTGFNGRVTSIVPLVTGEVYVGGYFTEFDGDPNGGSGLVRLQADGNWDDMNFVTTGVSDVNSVALATDIPFLGSVYSGGSVAITGNLSLIGRWGSGGGLDGAFVSALNPVLSVVSADDGTGDIYVGGSFTEGIARLSDAATDLGFAVGTGFDDGVLSIDRAVTTGGNGIYVGGSFTNYDSVPANGIVRLESDGSRDNGFMVGTGFTDPDGVFPLSNVANVVQDVSLDVFVGGGFTQYNGTASNGIVRLDPDGSLDTAFNVSITIGGEVCDSQTIPD